MKITFKGTFTTSDIKLINYFVEQQQTTDKETKNTTINFDCAISVKVVVNKYGDIEKLHFRNIERR